MALAAGCAVPLVDEVAHQPVPTQADQLKADSPPPAPAERQAGYAEVTGPAKPAAPGTNPDIQLTSVVTDNPVSKSISSALGDAAAGISSILTPEERVVRAPDATSLTGQPAEPSAKLYVSFARLYEQNNRLAEAEQQYQRALKTEPNHLEALLGYGRLKERVGKSAEATAAYLAAAKAHPNAATAFNHLGLSYARRGMLQQAKQAFERAIHLRPKNPGLRNHVAIVLVEMGRINEAFAHLRIVHGEAIAHYNIGCALHKKGKAQEAAQQFAAALQKNPRLVEARQWLDWLATQPAAPESIGRNASHRQPPSSSGGVYTSPFSAAGEDSRVIRPLPPTDPAGRATPSPPALRPPQSGGPAEVAPLPPVGPSLSPSRGPAHAPPKPLAPPRQPGQADSAQQMPVAPMPPGVPTPKIQPLPPVQGTSSAGN